MKSSSFDQYDRRMKFLKKILSIITILITLLVIDLAYAKSSDRLAIVKNQTDEALKMAFFNNKPDTANAKQKEAPREIESTEYSEDTEESIFSKTLRGVLILACVLGTLILTLYLMKNYLYGKKKFGKSKRWINIIDTICIAPKKTVSLIEVGELRLLIGITQNNMTTLAQMEIPPNEAEQVSQPKQEIEKETSSFKNILKNLQNNLTSLKKV